MKAKIFGAKIYIIILPFKRRRVRYGADGGIIPLRNLTPHSKQGVDNYYGENRNLATETTLPSYAY